MRMPLITMLMEQEISKKIIKKIKQSEIAKEAKGIRIVVLDKGGLPIYDNEGNIKGRTDPLLEFIYTDDTKLLLNAGIKQVMNEFFLEVEDVRDIWMAFLKMDKKERGFITLNHLMEFLSEKPYSVLAPFIEYFFSNIDCSIASDRCTFHELFPALVAFCMFNRFEII
jgi:hypothetical protein